MSFFKKKGGLLVIIVTALVLVSILIVHFTGSNPVSNAIRTVFSPFQNGAAYIADRINSAKNFVWEMSSYKEENEKLVERVNELERESKDVAQYREENERLQKLLELKSNTKDYTTVAASVIAYSSNNWYDTLEINKGTLNGVHEGNCVVSSDGVVGKVTAAGPNWATVSSIINTGSAIGVKVTRNGSLGIVEGDSELSEQRKCKMTFADSGTNLIVGDLLETSGSAGIYPPGYYIGKITEVKADNMGTLNYAIVEPAVDFSQLYEVLVINGITAD